MRMCVKGQISGSQPRGQDPSWGSNINLTGQRMIEGIIFKGFLPCHASKMKQSKTLETVRNSGPLYGHDMRWHVDICF